MGLSKPYPLDLDDDRRLVNCGSNVMNETAAAEHLREHGLKTMDCKSLSSYTSCSRVTMRDTMMSCVHPSSDTLDVVYLSERWLSFSASFFVSIDGK